MTSFVYYTATSMNGFIADERNSLDWLFEVGDADPELFADFMSGVGVQVMGSTTYEWLLDHEDLVRNPERWTALFGSLPTKVFSSRDLPGVAGADITVVNGPVGSVIDDLISIASGKDVWIVGGGDLAGQFLDAGHLDRIELTVAPVLLLGGAPVLPRAASSARLRLTAVERRGPFAHLVYEVTG